MDIGRRDRASSPRQNWHLSKLRDRRQTNHNVCLLPDSPFSFLFFPLALSFRSDSLGHAAFFCIFLNYPTSTFILVSTNMHPTFQPTHFLQLNHRPSIQPFLRKMAASSLFHCSVPSSFVKRSILFFTLYTLFLPSWFPIASSADTRATLFLILSSCTIAMISNPPTAIS